MRGAHDITQRFEQPPEKYFAAATSRSYVHGTSRPNVVAPRKLGTVTVTRAHGSPEVAGVQRAGGPKSSARHARVSASYPRRAGSIMTCAVSAIDWISAPLGSETSAENSIVGAAAKAT